MLLGVKAFAMHECILVVLSQVAKSEFTSVELVFQQTTAWLLGLCFSLLTQHDEGVLGTA